MPTGPLRLILIRAGRYDYADVELGGSLQIVGPNNTGKTTLINTLQFLYVDDLRTMNFGTYTLEQTLAYYFPGQYSYVLFECQGVAGRCVVGWRGQSRVSGGDPERFCFQGALDPDDFLEPSGQVREPRDVVARLALKDLRIIKSAQEHRELLLPPQGPQGRGLGLVALRDADRFRRFRESLKDLLQLSSISQEQMRDRLLTLADVRTDLPALDVRRLFGDDYDRIRSRRDGLARFRRHSGEVRSLVDGFGRLERLRGELKTRWADLRARKLAFEESHTATLARLADEDTAAGEALRVIHDTLQDRAATRDSLTREIGALERDLQVLEQRARAFAGFNPDLAAVAVQNLEREDHQLTGQLAQAETETREKARQKLAFFGERVRQKEQSIANFDRLAITALRRRFPDADLDRAFRVLGFSLLEVPLGADGVEIRDEAALATRLDQVARRVRDGVYEDETVRVVLPPPQRTVADLGDVEKIRAELAEYSGTLRHWEGILQAIEEREQLAARHRACKTELDELRRRIIGHEDFVQARSHEPRLQRDLQARQESVAQLSRETADLERRRRAEERRRQQVQEARRLAENAYHETLGRHGQCLFPEATAPDQPVPDLPPDFETAIAQYLHHQQGVARLSEEVDRALRQVTLTVGEEFNGADDAETVRHLAAELEALPEKTEALERDWNALIQGLRGTFSGVLKELDAVRSAVADLNRQFGRVQVSNLRSIKLEVLEGGDLVPWIRRLVDLQQPGLFDDDSQLDQTLRNFRDKLGQSPLISFAQLFSLGLAVEAEDGTRHHYQDLRQIESHGTTIAIKVLFNLLVLRRYLREDQCLVPFFLDEVQALDPANRHAILVTARKLGFIAITAAPESITEVEALYFLQPRQGRIVLRHRHRLGVQRPLPAATPADAA